MDGVQIEFLPAHDLAHRLRSGEISAVEVVAAHLERIAEVNPKLNAVVALDADGALAAARDADSLRARGAPLGPLHGVPVTIKDWIDVAGFPCTGGEPAYRDRVPTADATAVSRLRHAGAIVLGKTNVMTDNEVYGPTFNPHDLTRSPGGSSSGEAAIVAAGGSALGLGSDSGGSLRQPAHLCGVATIKPTTGLVPADRALPGHRTNARLPDRHRANRPERRGLAPGASRIAGEDGIDASAAPAPVQDWRQVDLRKMRVAWWTEQPDADPTAETVHTVQRAVTALEEAGARVVEARPDDMEEVLSLTHIYWSLPESQDLDAWRPTSESPLSAADLQEFRFRWGRFRRSLARFMANFDLMLLPAAERAQSGLAREMSPSPTPWHSASPASPRSWSHTDAIPTVFPSEYRSPHARGVTIKQLPPPTPSKSQEVGGDRLAYKTTSQATTGTTSCVLCDDGVGSVGHDHDVAEA